MNKTSRLILTVLRTPNNAAIATDDDTEGANAKIVLTIPTTGRYTVIAGVGVTTTGTYVITSSLATRLTRYRRWTLLSHNRSFTGAINANDDRDTFYISGVTGRILSFRMNRIDSSLDHF